MQRVRPGVTVAATQVAMDGNSTSLARYAVEDGRVARDLRREY
jgi:hypothetical protein